MGQNRWVVELAVKPGKLDEWQALAADMVAAIDANEPGALNYELFLSSDGTECTIYEEYADAAAVRTHLANFDQHFAKRFGAAVDLKAFTVLGDPDAEVREMLSGFGVAYMVPLAGVVR